MPDQQDKNEQLKFALDDIIAEVRRPGWSPASTPGVAMPEKPAEPQPPVQEPPVPQPEPVPEPVPEPIPEPVSQGPVFVLPPNADALAAHFAPDKPDKVSKKDRQYKKNRRREEKELEKQRKAEAAEAQRRNAAAARKAARENPADREYVPRRMKPGPEPESARLYREAMEQYGAPETPKKKSAQPRKQAPAKAAPIPEPEQHRKPRLPYDRFSKPVADADLGFGLLQEAMVPLSFSVILQGVVLLVALYLTAAAYYPLPLPQGFTYTGYTLLYAAILLGLQAISLILSWEVLRAGLWRLIRLKPTQDTLASLALLAALAHSILVVCRPAGLGSFFPLTVPAVFLGLWATLTKRRRADGLRRRYKVAATGTAPVAVKLTPDRPRIAVKTGRDPFFPIEEMAEPDPAETADRIFSPLALPCALALGMLPPLQAGRPELIPWGLSLMLLAAACPALMSAGAVPAGRAAKWLHNSGAVLRSYRAAKELARAEQMVLRDADLYPNDQVTLSSLKLADGVDLNRVLACAAGVTAHIGGGLDKCFADFARSQYVQVRPADDFELYDRGGATAILGGDSILMGTATFLTRMGVRIDEGLRLPHGIFLAINSRFCAVFEIRYTAHMQVYDAFQLARRAKVRPLLGTLDFTVTPMTLETKFHLKPDWCVWPGLQERFDLHEEEWGMENPALAMLSRDSALPYAEVLLCSAKLVKMTRRALVWGLLAALAGMGLMYMLVSGFKSDLATPMSLTVFHLLWLVPVHLQSWLNIRK